MPDSLAIIAFMVAGLPLAIVIWDLPVALGMGALLSTIAALAAGLAHVTLDLPLVGGWAFLVLLGLVPLLFAAGRSRARENLRHRWTGAEVLVFGALGCSVIALAVFAGPPLVFDARSIWFFHAKWLLWPGPTYLSAQTDPAVAFSHPDYPVLGPASTAVTWQIGGGEVDLFTGLVVVTLVNLAMVLVATLALLRLAPLSSPRVQAAVGVLMMVTLPAIHPGQGRNNGYMDVLQGVAILGVALLLIRAWSGRPSRADLASLMVVAMVGANVKQEGLPFIVAIGALAAAFAWRNPRGLGPIALALLPAVTTRLAWSMILGGGDPDGETAGIGLRVLEYLQAGSVAWQSLVAASGYVSMFSVPFIALAMVGLIATIRSRRPTNDARTMTFLVSAAVMVLGAVLATYTLGNGREHLGWWLETSYVRINATIAALCLGSAGLALLYHYTPERT